MDYLKVFYYVTNICKKKNVLCLCCLFTLVLISSFSFAAFNVHRVYTDTLPDSTIVPRIHNDTASLNKTTPRDSVQQNNGFISVFRPFRTFNKNTSIESVTNLTIQQQNVSYKTKADFTTQYTLDKHTDNQFLFDVSVTKLNTRVETMGLQLQYNSQDSVQQDTTSGFARPLFDIVGKTITLNVDSTGTILSVDTSDIGNKVGNVISGLSVAGENFQPGNNFGLMLNKNPDSLRLGYTWTDSSQINEKKRITKYTVQSRLHDEIVLLVNGTVEQTGIFQSDGHSFQTDFSGSQTGKIIVSGDNRLVTLRSIAYTMHGTVHFNGQDIPATATSRINETINP